MRKRSAKDASRRQLGAYAGICLELGAAGVSLLLIDARYADTSSLCIFAGIIYNGLMISMA